MTARIPFNPQKELLRWGPIPGRFGYVSMFAEVHYNHFRHKYPGENWSETLFLFKNKRLFWVNDLEAVRQAGLSVFLHYLLPKSSRQEIYHEWMNTVVDLQNWISETRTIDLSTIANKKLLEVWTKLHGIYQPFWTTGSIPELANYGSDNYLENLLGSYAKDKTEILSLMETLTAPTQLSFYQQEEIDLSQTSNIPLHTSKYFWLRNSYAGTEVLPEEFFKTRKLLLHPSVALEAETKLSASIKNKYQAQKKYQLTDEVMEVAMAISEGIGWQDERKKYVFQVLHYQDQIMNEVARRFGYNTDELHNTWYYDISDIINGKNLHDLLDHRAKGFGIHFYKNCSEINEDDTKKYWQLYSHETINENTKLFSGITASKGQGKKIIGSVRIVLDPTKSEQFLNGEILVAPMTSPEYIFAMRKAAAIVTDTGGLTSHAAIISRELGIPCIVGTKIATHILHNGDRVEIDPMAGTIKILADK